MNEERVAAGKCWIVAIIVLLLHVGPIYCTIVTLLKLNHTAIFGEQQTTESQQFSYAPYTATLWLGEHRTVNLLVDTTASFSFLKTCSQEFGNFNNCVNFKNEKYNCEEDIQNIFCRRQYSYYPLSGLKLPIDSPSFIYMDLHVQQKTEKIDYISFGDGFRYTTPENSSYFYLSFVGSKFYSACDGALGLGISPLQASFFQMFLSQYPPGKRQFALDLFGKWKPNANYTESDGLLLLGKDDIDSHTWYNINNNRMMWSERQYRVNSFLLQAQREYLFDMEYSFAVFNLSLCGSSLLSNYSSNWQAQINTRIDGIGLPEPFYNMVIAWLNNIDSIRSWNDSLVESLPVLSFALHENGELLHIPLSSVFERVRDINQFHVYNKGPVQYFGKIGIMRAYPLIDLGTRVLEHLFVVFDIDTLKVGFMQKRLQTQVERSYHNGRCKEKPKCAGLQTYYEPMNACLDPECYQYFFQTVDSNTKMCRLRLEFYFLFCAAVVVFVLLEVMIFEVHRKLSSYLPRTA